MPKSTAFNDYFSTVFVEDDGNNLQLEFLTNKRLSGIDFSPEIVKGIF